MKRYLMTILAVVLTTLTLKAMPYEMAREEAMYLTDKMAYELNLNQRQYEYVYEINLDYLMSLETAEDVYGAYLTFRNADIRHILYDWQWNIFATVDYFLHPVSWRSGRWFYPIYAHYARNYFFYSRPTVYHSYRGGHGHNHYGNHSFYADRRPHWESGFRGADRGHVANIGRPGMNNGNRPGMNYGNRPNTHYGYNSGMGNRPGINNGNRPGTNQNQYGRPNTNEDNHPNMNGGNRPNMNEGNRPNMGGNQPNMSQNGRPNMNESNRPNMGTYTQPNMGNRPNMGTRTQPNMGNRGGATMGGASRGGATMGGASRGGATMGGATRSAGSMSAGRGHAGGGRGGR